MTANTHSKQHKVRGYRAIAQFSGLGGPFMTGIRVAEFVRTRQKAYRLAVERLNGGFRFHVVSTRSQENAE